MSASDHRSTGTAVLVAGWSVVAAGAVVILTAIGDHSSGRNEHAGVGFALLMSGMLVVLAGNYIHHRARVEGDTVSDADRRDEDGRDPRG